MDFQKVADSLGAMTCVVSVDKIGEDDYGNVVINEGLSNEQQNALSIFSSLSEKRRQTALSVLKDMVSAEKNNL